SWWRARSDAVRSSQMTTCASFLLGCRAPAATSRRARSPRNDPPTARGRVMKRTRPEQAIQRAVFEHLRARGAPGVFAFHPANGGYRKPVEAAILKGLGVKPGVPDVIAIHNGRCFALELKAAGERATDKQLETIAALREAGAFTAIAEALDPALAAPHAPRLLPPP